MFHRGMIAAVALPHTGQRLRRWSEHLAGDGDGDAKMLSLNKRLFLCWGAVYYLISF